MTELESELTARFDVVTEGLHPRTGRAQRWIVLAFARFLAARGYRRRADVPPETIEAYLAAARDRWTPGTWANHASILRRVMGVRRGRVGLRAGFRPPYAANPFLHGYERIVSGSGLSPRTIVARISTIECFVRWLAEATDTPIEQTNLDRVQPSDVRAFLGATANELGPRTRVTQFSILRQLFAALVELGLVARNPFDLLHAPRKPAPAGTALTAEEVQVLLQVASAGPEPELEVAVLLFMLLTACRAGALVRVRLGDVDQEGGMVELHEKGGAVHRVPLHPVLQQALDAYLAVRRPRRPTDALFLNRRGQPLTYPALGDRMRALGRRAGIEGLHAHALRHTAATLAARSGAPVADVQQLLGHRDVATTSAYVHVPVEDLTYIANLDPLEPRSGGG